MTDAEQQNGGFKRHALHEGSPGTGDHNVISRGHAVVKCLLQQRVGQYSHQRVSAVDKGSPLRRRLLEVNA
ncbi:hypothetical protein D3C71_2080550 [compost metagenome]